MTISDLYEKYYAKKTKARLAYLDFYNHSGVKVCIAVKKNRKLAIKVGTGRWCIKQTTIPDDKKPIDALLLWKQEILSNPETELKTSDE